MAGAGRLIFVDTETTEYLAFDKYKRADKKTYDIVVKSTSGEELGTIHWRSGWRRYVFTSHPGVDYDTKCLGAIIKYIDGVKH